MRLVFKNKKRRIIATVVLVITLVAAGVGGFYLHTRYIKLFGITLTPAHDYPVTDIVYYLQNDPLWASDKIGDSSSTMGGTGCLITCVAVSLNDLGISITPKELNQTLCETGGYQGADLLWYKINEAFSDIDYSYERIFSTKTIEKDLKNGELPIVNVRINGVVTHWVLIIGSANGDFLIYDPLNKDEKPVPLTTYGKVYAYRVLHKVE